MAVFCRKCGNESTREGVQFCTHCGARLPQAVEAAAPQRSGPTARTGQIDTEDPWEAAAAAAGAQWGESDPAAQSFDQPSERVASRSVMPWEIVLLVALMAAWLALVLWRGGPTIVDVVRGESVATGRLIGTVGIILVPPLAVVAFLAGRLAGHGGWRWALPLLLVLPLLSGAAWYLDGDERGSGARTETSKPGTKPGASRPDAATSTPSAGAAPTATAVGPFGLPIPIPIPKREDPTPVPSAKLTADQARERVRQSLDRCPILRREIDIATVTYESPNWIVKLPSTLSWRVDDATGTVTPDELASVRQRLCFGS
jgi:hypothetical protein